MIGENMDIVEKIFSLLKKLGEGNLNAYEKQILFSDICRFRNDITIKELQDEGLSYLGQHLLDKLQEWVIGGTLKLENKELPLFKDCTPEEAFQNYRTWTDREIDLMLDRKHHMENIKSIDGKDFYESAEANIFWSTPIRNPEENYIGKEARIDIKFRPQTNFQQTARRRAFDQWEFKTKYMKQKYTQYWAYMQFEPAESRLWSFFAVIEPGDFIALWNQEAGNDPFPDTEERLLMPTIRLEFLKNPNVKLSEVYKKLKDDGIYTKGQSVFYDKISREAIIDDLEKLEHHAEGKPGSLGSLRTVLKTKIKNQKTGEKQNLINIEVHQDRYIQALRFSNMSIAKNKVINLVFRRILEDLTQTRKRFISEFKKDAKRGKLEFYGLEFSWEKGVHNPEAELDAYMEDWNARNEKIGKKASLGG
ncbi:hypothetical protein GF354_05185 [Candidatus Peregrinibacteria bacterium]|nr:hypothetical protein [Candidatus Peregrinibacteria bacterium]